MSVAVMSGRKVKPTPPIDQMEDDFIELSDDEIRDLSKQSRRIIVPNVLINPRTASTILQLNRSNRALTPGHVNRLAADIKGQNWQSSHQGIAISHDQRLLDGQHRLHAVVQADMSIICDVTFGLSPSLFSVIDTHRARNAADALSIMGMHNTAQMAAVLRALIMIKRGWRSGTMGSKVLSVPLIQEEFYKWANLSDIVSRGVTIRKTVKGFGAGTIAAICILYRDAPAEKVNAFISQIETGLGFSSGTDAAYVLRSMILQAGRAKRAVEEAAITIKAFNAFASGAPVRLLKWGASEPFPAVKS